MEVFTVNSDGKVSINPPIRTIEVFKKIISRDRGSEGDSDGRKKYKAMKDLSFIYFMEDPRSPYMHYPESERFNRILAGIQHEVDPKDELILEAREYYKGFETATSKTLKELREALLVSTKLIKIMRTQIENLLSKDDITTEEIAAASDLMNDLMAKGTKTPQIVSVIQEMEEKLKKEQTGTSQVKGGGSINPFEE